MKGNVAGVSNGNESNTPLPNPAPVVTPPTEPEPILGCTDQMAINYNADATKNDNTCTYEDPEPTPEPEPEPQAPDTPIAPPEENPPPAEQ